MFIIGFCASPCACSRAFPRFLLLRLKIGVWLGHLTSRGAVLLNLKSLFADHAAKRPRRAQARNADQGDTGSPSRFACVTAPAFSLRSIMLCARQSWHQDPPCSSSSLECSPAEGRELRGQLRKCASLLEAACAPPKACVSCSPFAWLHPLALMRSMVYLFPS
jgi:hypothetical protein